MSGFESTVETVSWGSNYTKYFAAKILEGTSPRAAILDAGCGMKLHPFYQEFRQRARLYHGCDPNPDAANHPQLDQYYSGTLETADLGDQQFDAIVSSYVLEHLEHPTSFFRTASERLLPGGRLFFLTPNRRHPFCSCVRLVENLNLKSRFHARYGKSSETDFRINDYPAYYRANTVAKVSSLAKDAGFSAARFSLVAGGWSHYFPKVARWVPALYDRMLANRLPQGHLILIGEIQK